MRAYLVRCRWFVSGRKKEKWTAVRTVNEREAVGMAQRILDVGAHLDRFTATLSATSPQEIWDNLVNPSSGDRLQHALLSCVFGFWNFGPTPHHLTKLALAERGMLDSAYQTTELGRVVGEYGRKQLSRKRQG